MEEFCAGQRTGQITLHIQDGRVVSLDVQERWKVRTEDVARQERDAVRRYVPTASGVYVVRS